MTLVFILGYTNIGITVGKICITFVLYFFFLGWGQTRYILGNRKSACGELLNEIVVTEGSLRTSSKSQDAKSHPRKKPFRQLRKIECILHLFD